MDIGRQRHLAKAFEHLEENALIVELHELVAVVHLADDRSRQLAVTERELRPRVRLAPGLREAFPHAVSLVAQ